MAQKKQGRSKHVPQRTCVVCHTTFSKRELTRLVKTPEDGLQIDLTGKAAGRGAYLCGNPACWQKAIKTPIVGQALRTSLTEQDKQRIAEAAPSV